MNSIHENQKIIDAELDAEKEKSKKVVTPELEKSEDGAAE